MCCVFLSLPHHQPFFYQINGPGFLHFLPLLILSLSVCVLCMRIFLVCVSFSWIPRNRSFTLFFCHFCRRLFFSAMKARTYTSSSSSSLKQEFFKKWIMGLQIYSSFKNEMTVFERKEAIKLSADVAIASTRNAAAHWSHALIAGVSAGADDTAKIVAEQISGRKISDRKAALTMACSKKIVRRSCMAHRRKARRVVRSSVKAASIAKKMVKRRTRVLQRLVPGGEEMDEVSLIKETLNYIALLQVQADVMRHIADVAESLDFN